MNFKPGQKLEHYKGMPYQFLFYAKHSESLEDYAVYECLYENESAKIWIRPKAMFEEKLPNAEGTAPTLQRFAPTLMEDGQPERLLGCSASQTQVAAARFNVRAWNFIDDWEELEEEDKAECLEYAYTSLSLWRELGLTINIARGHWLVAFILLRMNLLKLAKIHVDENIQYTQEAAETAKDFDAAFSLEIQARYSSLNREPGATELKKAAKLKGEAIADAKDRELFLKGFSQGPW
jgi:hypothetical protein